MTTDPIRLQQVLLNLVTNATSYSAKGSNIEVRAFREDDEVVLEVQDYGIGIPDDAKPQIFARVFQGERPTHSAHRGLGLFITREIVDAHGGHVELESVEGEGTTFQVYLQLHAEVASRQGQVFRLRSARLWFICTVIKASRRGYLRCGVNFANRTKQDGRAGRDRVRVGRDA